MIPRVALVPKRLVAYFSIPVLRRAAFHFKRMTSGLDGDFFSRLGVVMGAFLLLASGIVTLSERNEDGHEYDTVGEFLCPVHRLAVLGGHPPRWLPATRRTSQPPSATSSAGCWCSSAWRSSRLSQVPSSGSSSTTCSRKAREWAHRATGTTSSCAGGTPRRASSSPSSRPTSTSTKIVVIHDSDKNPAGDDVYFVNGDITTSADLVRAGIEDAMAAVVCPADGSNEADMKSILCVMAIESLAPQVRTVVEVNNPNHVEHFRAATPTRSWSARSSCRG